jgi:predicted nuclease of predicted toxin-antitoxin system
MKLLLDANLSWRLCPILAKTFGQCDHVNNIDLPISAKDSEIWRYAHERGYIIVTQDTDFLHFLEAKGYPPKLILLKTGNLPSAQLEEILIQAKESITELHENSEYGLLEIL